MLQSFNQEDTDQKKNKILIFHATADKAYMELLEDLLETLRLPTNSVICSSVPGYGIPGSKNFYDWLREQYLAFDVHVILALSHS